MPLRLAILTISDAGSRGERSDSSGDLIASWAKEHGYTLAERALVPDDTGRIAARRWWRVCFDRDSSPSASRPDAIIRNCDYIAVSPLRPADFRYTEEATLGSEPH